MESTPSTDKNVLTNRSFYGLIMYAVILGAVVGGVSAVFLLVEHELIQLIWEDIPDQIGDYGWYTLAVCLIGGTLVGLAQRFLGNYPKSMQEALEDVRTHGGFDVVHVPHGVVISLTSLVFGGALGPEAALIALAGGLGTWVARRIHMEAQQAHALTYYSVSGALGAFLGSPLSSAALPVESSQGDELPSYWTMVPGIFAGIAGLLVFLVFGAGTLGFDYAYIPYESPQDGSDLLLSVPLGLLGAILGWLYLVSHHRFGMWLQPLRTHKIIRGLLGGLVLGALATLSPLVLFSGQDGLSDLFVDGPQMPGGELIVIALFKLLAMAVCLTTGWKGGEIFPAIFAGAALGLGVATLSPAIHPMVGIVSVSSAVTTSMLRKPIAVVLLMVFLFPATLIVPITVGAALGAAVTLPIQSHSNV